MIAGASGADLYARWCDYIDDEQTEDAFSYIVGLAASLQKYKCYPREKGEVLDFRFEDEANEIPFAFIVNKRSLLFYFRKPAIRSGRYSTDRIEVDFDLLERDNSAGEWRIRLCSIADVKRLWRILDLS